MVVSSLRHYGQEDLVASENWVMKRQKHPKEKVANCCSSMTLFLFLAFAPVYGKNSPYLVEL
jgi:hypothetical protein